MYISNLFFFFFTNIEVYLFILYLNHAFSWQKDSLFIVAEIDCNKNILLLNGIATAIVDIGNYESCIKEEKKILGEMFKQ